MFTKCYAATLTGIEAILVEVETNVSPGLGMSLVGLPDNAVKESQERIRSAFMNSDVRMPGKRIIVNLAPADIKKEGSALDLSIAAAILGATEQIAQQKLTDYMIMGELSLDGTVKPIKGALPIAINAHKNGLKGIVLPISNADEAAVVEGLEVIGVTSLREFIDWMNGNIEITPHSKEMVNSLAKKTPYAEDFADVKGQGYVKRALEVAVAGGHNVIMIGSPGSGKTMLARRMPTIMPPLTLDEALETTKIHSVAGKLGADMGLMTQRPFRSPHHTTSPVALVGGGSNPQPGEISLAHNGILFLDELPEFGRNILEVLRQPLEDKNIMISRAKYSIEYPANFMLVASMNPCPCGYYNHPTKDCVCSSGAVFKYINKISGPLFDRIDLHVEVVPVSFEEMSDPTPAESSATIRERVIKARQIQSERFKGLSGVHTNAMMSSSMIKEFCKLSDQCTSLLGKAMDKLNLSARAYDRIIKVARTIADLADSKEILPQHIAEAINYRSLDRANWGQQ